MNNNIDQAVGFSWQRSDRTSKRGNWLRDLAMALVIALAASLLCAVGNAYAQQKSISIAGAERTTMVVVTIGKSQDVRTETSFVEVTVGDPDVADVNPLTDHSLSILAKKIGTTRVSVYAEGKKLVGIFDIEVTYDISRLTNELARRFPGSRITASSVNGRIMLSGSVADSVTLDRAVTIARQFGPDIINAVSVAQPQQVMLEVRFLEISRTAGRELGFQWNAYSANGNGIANIGNGVPASGLPIPVGTTTAAGVLSGATPFGFLLGRVAGNLGSIDAMVNALERKGVARSLAEPNLVALSGDTASFLAGGEFPVPVPGQLGQVTIDYKRYGVGLAFTPTVLNGSLVNLKIDPEVSQLDTSHPVTIGGISVPPLIVRRASTTVELRDGQSFAIGGLLQAQSQTAAQQLPWLGDVPVLGMLFRSAEYQKNETDLVIIVTPRLVRPARPGDPLKTPLDDTLPPNDGDFFLMGKHELTPSMMRVAVGSARPFTGHMLDMPQGGSYAAIH